MIAHATYTRQAAKYSEISVGLFSHRFLELTAVGVLSREAISDDMRMNLIHSRKVALFRV